MRVGEAEVGGAGVGGGTSPPGQPRSATKGRARGGLTGSGIWSTSGVTGGSLSGVEAASSADSVNGVPVDGALVDGVLASSPGAALGASCAFLTSGELEPPGEPAATS